MQYLRLDMIYQNDECVNVAMKRQIDLKYKRKKKEKNRPEKLDFTMDGILFQMFYNYFVSVTPPWSIILVGLLLESPQYREKKTKWKYK